MTAASSAFTRRSTCDREPSAAAMSTLSYNFVRIHRTLRVTPAMAAGVTGRLWDVSDIVAVLEASEKAGQQAA